MIKLFFTTALLVHYLILFFILWHCIDRADFFESYTRATLISELKFYGIVVCCNFIIFIICIKKITFSHALLFFMPVAIILGVLTGYIASIILRKHIDRCEYLKIPLLHLISLISIVALIIGP